jgi:hypothetical protein
MLYVAGGPPREDESPESRAYRALYRPGGVVFIAMSVGAAILAIVRHLT